MLYSFPANGCGQSQCNPAWRAPLVEGIYNSPAVVDGVVYVGTASNQGRLYAFDAAGCGSPVCTTPLWKSVHLSILDSSPTVADGVVYVGSFGTGVYAFDAAGCGGAEECEPLWAGTTSGYVINSPTVANGVVYAGDSDGKLYAFDAAGCGAAACEPLWTGIAGAAIFSSTAAVVNGVVYIGSFYDGKLNAFAAEGCGTPTCDPLWVGNAGTYVDSSPAVAYGRVYVGSGDGELKVFDAAGCGQASCNPLWRGTAPGTQATMESSPMVANGVVYVGKNNNRVYAFRAAGCGRQILPARVGVHHAGPDRELLARARERHALSDGDELRAGAGAVRVQAGRPVTASEPALPQGYCPPGGRAVLCACAAGRLAAGVLRVARFPHPCREGSYVVRSEDASHDRARRAGTAGRAGPGSRARKSAQLGRNGFLIENSAVVPVDAMTAWKALINDVGKWWPADHTWFGRSEHLRIDARAGGCFCEIDGERQVLHMTISFS